MSRAPIRYVKGDWKTVCDACGRFFLASDLIKRWDGKMVCKADWEPRQPQDFVKAKVDIQAAPWTRPQTADTFESSISSLPPTSDTVPPGTFN